MSVTQVKYQFPVAVCKREQLEAFFRATGAATKLPPNVPYFEVRVPNKFNPLVIDKTAPDAIEEAKRWQEAGCEVELI